DLAIPMAMLGDRSDKRLEEDSPIARGARRHDAFISHHVGRRAGREIDPRNARVEEQIHALADRADGLMMPERLTNEMTGMPTPPEAPDARRASWDQDRVIMDRAGQDERLIDLERIALQGGYRPEREGDDLREPARCLERRPDLREVRAANPAR